MADLVKMWTPEIGYSFNEGEYTYTVIGSQQLNAEATSKDKTSYFSVQESFYLNGVLYTVTSMDECYRGCVNLTSAPSIPASVTSMNYCFEGCTKLTGDIEVNNNPISYESIFDNTTSPIFIVDNTINNSSNWQTIAQDYENVHYEATDNQAPQLGVLQVVRGKYELDSNNNWKWTEDDSGDDIKVTLNATLFTDLLPESWRSNIYIERFYIEINNTEILPGVNSRQYIVDSSSYTEESGIRKYKSPLILYILDYENSGNLKINVTDNYNHQSSTATETVYNLFVMFDFFPGGQGAAIGKASERNGLDIAIPTTIGEGLLPAIKIGDYKNAEAPFDSEKTYYIFNSTTEKYEEVDNPDAGHLSDYFEAVWIVDLNNYQLIIGQYNEQNNEALFIIGNGDDDNNRSNLMEVGTDLITIGDKSGSHLKLDYRSLQLIDRDGYTYFYVSELLDKNGNITEETEFVIPDVLTDTITIKVGFEIDTIIEVLADGIDVTSDATFSQKEVTITNITGLISNLVITYTPYSPSPWYNASYYKAYTLGIRSKTSDGHVGAMSTVIGYSNDARGFASLAEGGGTIAAGDYSHSEGSGTEAIGHYSHAEGNGTTASGDYSHAGGYYTIANEDNQTVIGKFNDNQSDTAFEIGNGTVSTPSNALTVDWNGNVMAQGMAGQIITWAGFAHYADPNISGDTDILIPANNTTIYEPIPGWLICNGAEISRTTYATLFKIIGTTYGSGDGSTTFNIPDFRGRVGIGGGTGTATGATNHTLNQRAGNENAIIVTHSHKIGASDGTRQFVTRSNNSTGVGEKGAASGTAFYAPSINSADNWYGTENTMAATGGESGTGKNMQPYIGINYLIATGKTS